MDALELEFEYYTWAYLNAEYVPVMCTRKRASKWYRNACRIARMTVNSRERARDTEQAMWLFFTVL
jgi:hypothetical protein